MHSMLYLLGGRKARGGGVLPRSVRRMPQGCPHSPLPQTTDLRRELRLFWEVLWLLRPTCLQVSRDLPLIAWLQRQKKPFSPVLPANSGSPARNEFGSHPGAIHVCRGLSLPLSKPRIPHIQVDFEKNCENQTRNSGTRTWSHAEGGTHDFIEASL